MRSASSSVPRARIDGRPLAHGQEVRQSRVQVGHRMLGGLSQKHALGRDRLLGALSLPMQPETSGALVQSRFRATLLISQGL
jgi:hypothetical protein